MNTSTSTVVQTNNRSAHLESEVHELVDLFGKHFAKCATEHGEVLGEEEHLASFNGSPSGDDTVGVGALFETCSLRAMASKHVEFVEGAWIAEVLNALTSEEFALALVALDGPGATRIAGLLLTVAEVVDLVLH